MASLLHTAGIIALIGYVMAVPNTILAPPRNTRVERLWCPQKAGRGETPVTCVSSSECPPERQLWSGGAERDDPPDRRIATCNGGDLVCCLPQPSKLTKKTRPKRQVYRYDGITDENLSLVRAVLQDADSRDRQQTILRNSFIPQRTLPPGWVISFSYGPTSNTEAVSQYPYDSPTPLIPSYGTNVYQPIVITDNGPGIKVHVSQATSQIPYRLTPGTADFLLGKDRVNPQNAPSNALELAPSPESLHPTSGRKPGVTSQKMCEKYAQLTSQNVDVSHLLPGSASIPVKINTCSNFDMVIVGGTNATKGEFPHMAALGFQAERSREWICGGSLISEQWVLTAAHCLYTAVGSPRWVRLGWLGGSDPPVVEETVASVHRHPGFSQRSKYNDLGLIRLSKSVPLSLSVRPACLPPPPSPSQVNPRTGTRGVATGWGKTSFTVLQGCSWFKVLQGAHVPPPSSYGVTVGESSPSLLKVSLRVVDNNRCKRAYQAEMFGDFLNEGITKELICAGDEKAKDTCQGDSGGPFQTSVPEQNNCVFRILGVTTYGKACGIGVPGLYTNVAQYLGWVEDLVWPA